MNRIIRKIKKIKNYPVLDKGAEQDTVFIAGTGRSGTTWIQETINYRNDFRLMFEPFHKHKTGLVKDWNYRQYLPPENRDRRFLEPTRKLLRGKVRSHWIDQYNTVYFPRKRIVKDIRTQLILKWMQENFPDIRIILLMRHPCAVTASKLNLDWDTHLNDFLDQEPLVEDFLSPYREEMQRAKTSFDRHIFLWCVENYVPLKQFSKGQIHVAFYEDLSRDPANQMKQVMAFLDEPFSDDMIKRAEKPSAMSSETTDLKSQKTIIDSWRKHVSSQQIDRACEILQLFGLDKIYNEGSYPLMSGNEALDFFQDNQPAAQQHPLI